MIVYRKCMQNIAILPINGTKNSIRGEITVTRSAAAERTHIRAMQKIDAANDRIKLIFIIFARKYGFVALRRSVATKRRGAPNPPEKTQMRIREIGKVVPKLFNICKTL